MDYALVGRGWQAKRGEIVGSSAVPDHLGVTVTLQPEDG
jgi:hypothetical protein